MSDTTVVVNLLGLGEDAKPTYSKATVRLLVELNFDGAVDVVRPHSPFIGASLPSCIAAGLRWQGVEPDDRPVIIFSNMPEMAWRNLEVRLGRLLPDVVFTRQRPVNFTGSEHMQLW